MDPACIIGTASAILSFVQSSAKVISTAIEIRGNAGQATKSDQALGVTVKEFNFKLATLRSQVPALHRKFPGLSVAEDDTQISLQRCSAQCEDLGSKIETLLRNIEGLNQEHTKQSAEKFKFRRSTSSTPSTGPPNVHEKARFSQALEASFKSLRMEEDIKSLRGQWEQCIKDFSVSFVRLDTQTRFQALQKFSGTNSNIVNALRRDLQTMVIDHKDANLKALGSSLDDYNTQNFMASNQLWADETTMRFQVDPKFHHELLGAQGSEINKLQNRYKVLIFFPQGEKGGKDNKANTNSGDEAGKNHRQQAADEVIIWGPSKGVSQAYDELKDLINWLKTNSFTATVTVQRLVATLQRESILTRASPDVMKHIGAAIIAAFPADPKVSGRVPPSEHQVVFELDWDPAGFIKEQQYAEKTDEVLANAITLTGACDDAQALTSLGYMSQTWPTTGESAVTLLCDAMCNESHPIASSIFPDGTEVEVCLNGSNVIVSALGIAESLADVGQQFAWLAAALRSSPFPTGIAECTPTISRGQQSPDTTKLLDQRKSDGVFFHVTFDIQKPRQSPPHQPGQCWRPMFRNPVMVQGYPILTKHERSLGLEIPLNMMAGLLETNQVLEFDQKTFIKGFSAMLSAVKSTKDLLIWHYTYNNDGERISYNSHQADFQKGINFSDVSKMRQVIGWCADCTLNAGAADAAYDVRRTGLPRSHPGCMLEKVSLTGGKLVTGGLSFAVGTKDKPIHLTRNGYIKTLKWLSTENAVLWDEEEKRGWLVNGTSALLHLVRTSLKHYSEDDFSSVFLFDSSKMENQMDYKPHSAAKVLISERNRDLEIYPGEREQFEQEEFTHADKLDDKPSTNRKTTRKRGCFLFEDLVKQHASNLEQIIDYQMRASSQDGLKMKTRLRKHLEGWDFVELATDHDLYPRVATLQALGYGWVDFVRSTNSVILFGRGFGEIIKPAECSAEICINWRSLPSHWYYLAISMVDLERIKFKYGDPEADPPQPVRQLIWHCPSGVVSACSCRSGDDGVGRPLQQHHDPVQVFYPAASKMVFRHLRGPGRLSNSGAVVFGHNVSWRYRWMEDAESTLEEGQPWTSHSPKSSRTKTPRQSRLPVMRLPRFSALYPSSTSFLSPSSALAQQSRLPVMRPTPGSASGLSRISSTTSSGRSGEDGSSAGASSSMVITPSQSHDSSTPPSSTTPLSVSDVAYASGHGEQFEHTDDHQRARTRRREKRHMQQQ